jgi:hypothetical protein
MIGRAEMAGVGRAAMLASAELDEGEDDQQAVGRSKLMVSQINMKTDKLNN